MTKKVKADVVEAKWKDAPASGRQVSYIQGLLVKAGTGNVKRVKMAMTKGEANNLIQELRNIRLG